MQRKCSGNSRTGRTARQTARRTRRNRGRRTRGEIVNPRQVPSDREFSQFIREFGSDLPSMSNLSARRIRAFLIIILAIPNSSANHEWHRKMDERRITRSAMAGRRSRAGSRRGGRATRVGDRAAPRGWSIFWGEALSQPSGFAKPDGTWMTRAEAIFAGLADAATGAELRVKRLLFDIPVKLQRDNIGCPSDLYLPGDHPQRLPGRRAPAARTRMEGRPIEG